VRHFPPALTILALAVSVNFKAATVSLGTSRTLMSSVTVPTTTAILSLKSRERLIPSFLEDTIVYLLLLAEVTNETGKRQGRSVHSGSNESSQHCLCES
jgi:hypothetical protein